MVSHRTARGEEAGWRGLLSALKHAEIGVVSAIRDATLGQRRLGTARASQVAFEDSAPGRMSPHEVQSQLSYSAREDRG
jgi:hypothetical protein